MYTYLSNWRALADSPLILSCPVGSQCHPCPSWEDSSGSQVCSPGPLLMSVSRAWAHRSSTELSAFPRAVGLFAGQTCGFLLRGAPIPGTEPGIQWMSRCVAGPSSSSLSSRVVGELNYLKLGTLATWPAWQAWMCDWVVQCTDAAFCAFSRGKWFILSWKLQDSALKGTVASWAGGEKPPHPPILFLSGFHLVWVVFPLQISVSSFVKAAQG